MVYSACVQRPDQDRFSESHLLIKHIFIRNFVIASLVLTCSSIAGRTRPIGQANRAAVGSVTPGDWFSDCVGAAYVHVEVGSPRSNSTRINVSHLIERSDYLSHITPRVTLRLHYGHPVMV